MSKSLKAIAYIGALALGLASQAALANPIPNVSYSGSPTLAGTYNPSMTDNNVISHNICGLAGQPSCASVGTGNFQDVWTFSFTTTGLLTLSATNTTLPNVNQFDVFNATLFSCNPPNAGCQVATAFPLNPNPVAINVIAGLWTLVLNWSLAPGGVVANSSALYSVNVTTAPGVQVPEPATLALIGIALAGLSLARRKQA